MEIDLPAGKYVVAVSGGVDSVVLLDLLNRRKKMELAVAHFDHGIRADSGQDRKFAESLSRKYGLEFYYEEGNLGPAASEALAREKRYAFLEKVRARSGASAVITAHHQDDLLETAIINLLRGTGRKGLSSLKSTGKIIRPLLRISKLEIKIYAKQNHLTWREDPTNADEKYLRNYVRRQIVAKFSTKQRETWLQNLDSVARTNRAADEIITELLAQHALNNQLDRRWFASLPHDVSKEILAAWLRQNSASFDRKRLEQLTVLCKTRPPGKQLDVDKRAKIVIEPKFLIFSGA